MKNKEFFTVKHDSTDISLKVKDYVSNEAPLPLEAGQYLYVGYYKPFKNFYIEFSELNTAAVAISFEYLTSNGWVELPDVINETEDFKKSGFIYFTRPKDWVEGEQDTDTNFYVRIKTDINLDAATKVKGLNVLLSNDNDLIGVRSNIVSKHNNGKSWIEKHEMSRQHIIQQLRNLGYRKAKASKDSPIYHEGKSDSVIYSNLTQFDLLEPFELRQAAKFYALAYIYLDELSDEVEDKWHRAGIRHEQRADEALNVFMLKLDINDDGVENPDESSGDTGVNLSWV